MNSTDADFRRKFYELLITRDKQADELNATVRKIAALYNERHELARDTEVNYLDAKSIWGDPNIDGKGIYARSSTAKWTCDNS
tara:strand:+ start:403 stop:651 length:249 start_codon:yes stop_codon:yes gene_type:complete